MGKIKDLPLLERPREKAIRYGIETLSDSELLAILLGSGYRGKNVTEVANALLVKSYGLSGVSNLSFYELKKIKGIKENKALMLASVFEIHKRLNKKQIDLENKEVNCDNLYYKYKDSLSSSFQELLILVIVDKNNRSLYESVLYKGNSSRISFSLKDLYRELLSHKGKGFYLIHNHPNGEKCPSNDDILLSKKIFEETKKMHIHFLDHIIIGDDGYTSISSVLKVGKPAI